MPLPPRTSSVVGPVHRPTPDELIAERQGLFDLLRSEVIRIMALETAVTINQLDPANPAGPDRLAQGDDHIRLIKAAIKATFPNITGPVTVTQQLLNGLSGLAVPVGVISLWYGADTAVPTGYALCNGQTVNRSDGSGTITTPDMRGRVPVGASGAHAAGSTFGQDAKTVTSATAGDHTHTASTAAGEGGHNHTISVDAHTLTIDEIPSHTHGLQGFQQESLDRPGLAGAGGNLTVQLDTGATGGGQPHGHGASLTGAGTHQHTVSVNGVAAHAHSVDIDCVQASIALHYIMKV